MEDSRSRAGARGENALSGVGSALRRRLSQVAPVDRTLGQRESRRQRIERLRAMYEELRLTYRPRLPEATADLPDPDDVADVEHAARLANHIYVDFFNVLGVDGEFDRALVTFTRRLIEARDVGRARSVAQLMQRYQQLRPVADICLALCAVNEPMWDAAWTLFTRNDPAVALRHAASEYLRLGFLKDPAMVAGVLEGALNEPASVQTDIDGWTEIAYAAFCAGFESLCARALGRADDALPEVGDPARVEFLGTRISTLRSWLELSADASRPVEQPVGEIPFALIDYQHPDFRRTSNDLSDFIETLATLGHLARRQGVDFTGMPKIAALGRQLRDGVAAERRAPSSPATVRLYAVHRDASRYAAVPEGTWTVVADWFAHPLSGRRYDIPLNPALRPIFISFYTDVASLAAPGAIEYLRRYAPIGCLDWDTVFLLQAAEIPAFFSGAISSTVDLVVDPDARPGSLRSTVFVDSPSDEPGQRRTLRSEATRNRRLIGNLTAAVDNLRAYRDTAARLVTSDLRCYLAARAVGCTAEFRPVKRGDAKTADLRGIAHLKGIADLGDMSGPEFAAMQSGISQKLAAVFDAVFAGRPEAEVYETWRQVCAADVAEAEARRTSVTSDLALTFDVAEVCDVIGAGSVTFERTAPGPDGPEINVEFSLDENYKHQLDIVLDSIVSRASRPVRAFVLCRNHGAADFERMARLFPTVSFVWLPSDNVDYGQISGLNAWVTPATMDRTVLPVLLPEIERIIHFDLDALCLTDLAELFDVDMAGRAIAAATEPQPSYVSGFETLRRSASRLRREGRPDLARELIIRTHYEHAFDFQIFNAGIMVLDLAKMRADDFCGRYLPYVQTFGVNGQVVLNIYLGSKYARLDGDWNRLLRLEVSDEAKVAHWAGPYKPWRPHQYVTGREFWRDQEDAFARRVGESADRAPATAG